MAQRRMFSPDIVCSDAFMEMPTSSRELYFQLGMRADDDGFVSPRGIMRYTGASEDDLKVLTGKRFVIPFENGVVVVKHWRINNQMRKDWYRPSIHTEQRKMLLVKENGAYTQDSEQGTPLVNESVPTREHSIDKYSIGNIPALPAGATIEEISEKPQKEPKPQKAVYEPLLRWAEGERGSTFVHRTKQYAALAEARKAGIKSIALKERWLEMSEDEYWVKTGFDWKNVVTSFNRKGA